MTNIKIFIFTFRKCQKLITMKLITYHQDKINTIYFFIARVIALSSGLENTIQSGLENTIQSDFI